MQHSKFAHFETLRKGFDESEPSKVPYICYQNIGFSFSLYIKFLKIYQLFCDQNIKKKKKIGMQATAIFQKWNRFGRMAVERDPN